MSNAERASIAASSARFMLTTSQPDVGSCFRGCGSVVDGVQHLASVGLSSKRIGGKGGISSGPLR